MMSNENQFSYNVVGNFHSFHLSPRTAQSEIRSSENPRFIEDQISDYGIPKVGDVIDSTLIKLRGFDQATTLGAH